MFLANYADVLTDAPLSDMIERFAATDAYASLLAAPMQSIHHVVDVADDGRITRILPVRDLRHGRTAATSSSGRDLRRARRRRGTRR